MRGDDSKSADKRSSPDQVRASARERIRDVVAERRRLEASLRSTMDELPQVMREAHDAGLSWAEIAELAGYRSAAVARNQAAPRGDNPKVSEDTGVTVREAAERLGVTPQAVYAMIESGRIQVVDRRQRGTRVHLPPAQASP